ncbi:MAG: hopanoid biosynthesis associated radical SAM protein HpnJ [Candidatus Eremiobacteraeota bacterium]|nr:hopanoid biosynthesis associated radical SAM protein HpnJ [Candidatus Eremiobacteraeota bacterium]MBV8499151.1 hopanoid biosynthesis associated radical SAM protein HpnJ [Candidatus Eremiobacteraeota bacterium]
MTGRKTLFLNPPSFEGYDGGAGSRYQCRREVRSFWYPTWLAQPAAMVPGSRLIDAPPDDLTMDQVAPLAKEYDSIVLHTSTPSFNNDARVAQRLKSENPDVLIGMVGAHVGVLPEPSLRGAPAVDWVSVGEFDYTCVDVAAGRPLPEIDGLAYRRNGEIVRTPERPTITDMDAFPSVLDVYRRDLTIPNYFNGYLQHPYISLYTGRGCKSKCTFCLWPQTIGGHLYRVRSVESVAAEMARAKELFPEVREFFFDDDTLTDNVPRVEEIARRLGPLGITWSCNAKPNVPRSTLEIMKANGLRLLLVGYESGNQQVLNNMKKGTRLDIIRRFSKDCRELGIKVHGTFILGMPGETPETIRETIDFACEMDPETIQVSLAAPYPGTYLYRQAQENGWLEAQSSDLVDTHGVQHAALNYPGLTSTMMFASVDEFYRRFYFRPRKMFSLLGGMIGDRQVMKRRLREGVEFFHFLRERKREQAAAQREAALSL